MMRAHSQHLHLFQGVILLFLFLYKFKIAFSINQPTAIPSISPSISPTDAPLLLPCSACRVGSFYNTYTLSSSGSVIGCTPCDVGYICSGGCASPVPCPVGTYSNLYGQSSCSSCPTGYYNLITGQVNQSICNIY